jgi:hypothetical protein
MKDEDGNNVNSVEQEKSDVTEHEMDILEQTVRLVSPVGGYIQKWNPCAIFRGVHVVRV